MSDAICILRWVRATDFREKTAVSVANRIAFVEKPLDGRVGATRIRTFARQALPPSIVLPVGHAVPRGDQHRRNDYPLRSYNLM